MILRAARQVLPLCGILLMALPLGANPPAGDEARLATRRQLEARLMETRQRLLRDDAELRELNERIQGLQRLLARKLEGHAEIQPLRRELEALEPGRP